MGNNQHRALVVGKSLHKPLSCFKIQMVGRLVQQKQIRPLQHYLKQNNLCRFAARQHINGLLKLLTVQLEHSQNGLNLGSVKLREIVPHKIHCGFGTGESQLLKLIKIAYFKPVRNIRAAFTLKLAQNKLHKTGFAASVCA